MSARLSSSPAPSGGVPFLIPQLACFGLFGVCLCCVGVYWHLVKMSRQWHLREFICVFRFPRCPPELHVGLLFHWQSTGESCFVFVTPISFFKKHFLNVGCSFREPDIGLGPRTRLGRRGFLNKISQDSANAVIAPAVCDTQSDTTPR